jgi:hypothetical protein
VSTPGWYPDPGGQPGRFRYWNGSSWSDQTSAQPGPPPSGRPGSRRWIGVVLGIGFLVLVVVVIVILLARYLIGDSARVADPAPSSTVSAWDDSQPTASPTPSPSPSPPPSPSDPPSKRSVPCPVGDPSATAAHPNDGRVHGGRLSFPRIGFYEQPGPKYGLSWFYDVGSQSQTTEPGWESWFAVGELATAPGFETPREAVDSSMQCTINQGWFSGFTGRKDLRDEKFTLDGREGWILSTEVRVDNPSISVEGDVVTIMIIDDGRPDRLSGYVSIVPIGDQPRNQIAAETLANLRLG